MATVTLSSKNQITLPVEMVRALGLKAGDKLDIEHIDDRLVIWKKPANYADYFSGRLKGTWGNTVEEMDRYVAEERASWETHEEARPGHRDKSHEEAVDFLTGHDVINRLALLAVQGLRSRLHYRASYAEVLSMMNLHGKIVSQTDKTKALDRLVKDYRILRQIGNPGESGQMNEVEYRLYSEFVTAP